MSRSSVPAVSQSLQRELVGICKHSMLQLGLQLRQYITELHADIDITDVKPFVQIAANEYCGGVSLSNSMFTDHTNSNTSATVTTHSDDITVISELFAHPDPTVNISPLEHAIANSSTHSDHDIAVMSDDALNAFGQLRQFNDDDNEGFGAPLLIEPSCSRPSFSCDKSPFSAAVKMEQSEVLEVVSVNPMAEIGHPSSSSTPHYRAHKHNRQHSKRMKPPFQSAKQALERAKYQSKRRVNKPFCPYCDWGGLRVFLYDHMEVEHSNRVTITSEQSRRSRDWLFGCPHCPIKLTGLASLERHINSRHAANPDVGGKVRTFKCPECDTTFKRRDHRAVHMRMKHHLNT